MLFRSKLWGKVRIRECLGSLPFVRSLSRLVFRPSIGFASISSRTGKAMKHLGFSTKAVKRLALVTRETLSLSRELRSPNLFTHETLIESRTDSSWFEYVGLIKTIVTRIDSEGVSDRKASERSFCFEVSFAFLFLRPKCPQLPRSHRETNVEILFSEESSESDSRSWITESFVIRNGPKKLTGSERHALNFDVSKT